MQADRSSSSSDSIPLLLFSTCFHWRFWFRNLIQHWLTTFVDGGDCCWQRFKRSELKNPPLLVLLSIKDIITALAERALLRLLPFRIALLRFNGKSESLFELWLNEMQDARLLRSRFWGIRRIDRLGVRRDGRSVGFGFRLKSIDLSFDNQIVSN